MSELFHCTPATKHWNKLRPPAFVLPPTGLFRCAGTCGSGRRALGPCVTGYIWRAGPGGRRLSRCPGGQEVGGREVRPRPRSKVASQEVGGLRFENKKESQTPPQIPTFRLQTSDFRLPTSDFRLPDFRLQTSDFRLQTSDLGPQTSDLGTVNKTCCPVYYFSNILLYCCTFL